MCLEMKFACDEPLRPILRSIRCPIRGGFQCVRLRMLLVRGWSSSDPVSHSPVRKCCWMNWTLVDFFNDKIPSKRRLWTVRATVADRLSTAKPNCMGCSVSIRSLLVERWHRFPTDMRRRGSLPGKQNEIRVTTDGRWRKERQNFYKLRERSIYYVSHV